MTLSHPVIRMQCTLAAHSILTFPLLFAFSLFNEAQVQLFAPSHASGKNGWFKQKWQLSSPSIVQRGPVSH